MAQRYSGTCTAWKQRFGFVAPDHCPAPEVYAHFEALVVETGGYRALRPGQRVEFSLETKNGTPRAVRVTAEGGQPLPAGRCERRFRPPLVPDHATAAAMRHTATAQTAQPAHTPHTPHAAHTAHTTHAAVSNVVAPMMWCPAHGMAAPMTYIPAMLPADCTCAPPWVVPMMAAHDAVHACDGGVACPCDGVHNSDNTPTLLPPSMRPEACPQCHSNTACGCPDVSGLLAQVNALHDDARR